MKTIGRILMVLLCMAVAVPGICETLTYGSFSADSEAEYLNIELNQIIEDYEGFYSFLSKFPNLKKVDMFSVKIYNKKVEELHERFPDIEFGMTMGFGEHTLRTDDTAFSTLHEYDSVWHSSGVMSIVRYCKNMYALDLGHNSFQDLSFLYEMPQLRVLIVAIGDATDITPIGSLKHLEYLEIFHNQIHDISCLADLPYLMDLNIVNNRIEDLTPLKSLKSLKRLWIFRYSSPYMEDPVDEEILADLQEALPDCYIDGHSTSTAGGWREHPHYDVIYRIFHTRIYEPFADSPAENIPDGFEPAAEETVTAEEADQ